MKKRVFRELYSKIEEKEEKNVIIEEKPVKKPSKKSKKEGK